MKRIEPDFVKLLTSSANMQQKTHDLQMFFQSGNYIEYVYKSKEFSTVFIDFAIQALRFYEPNRNSPSTERTLVLKILFRLKYKEHGDSRILFDLLVESIRYDSFENMAYSMKSLTSLLQKIPVDIKQLGSLFSCNVVIIQEIRACFQRNPQNAQLGFFVFGEFINLIFFATRYYKTSSDPTAGIIEESLAFVRECMLTYSKIIYNEPLVSEVVSVVVKIFKYMGEQSGLISRDLFRTYVPDIALFLLNFSPDESETLRRETLHVMQVILISMKDLTQGYIDILVQRDLFLKFPLTEVSVQSIQCLVDVVHFYKDRVVKDAGYHLLESLLMEFEFCMESELRMIKELKILIGSMVKLNDVFNALKIHPNDKTIFFKKMLIECKRTIVFIHRMLHIEHITKDQRTDIKFIFRGAIRAVKNLMHYLCMLKDAGPASILHNLQCFFCEDIFCLTEFLRYSLMIIVLMEDEMQDNKIVIEELAIIYHSPDEISSKYILRDVQLYLVNNANLDSIKVFLTYLCKSKVIFLILSPYIVELVGTNEDDVGFNQVISLTERHVLNVKGIASAFNIILPYSSIFIRETEALLLSNIPKIYNVDNNKEIMICFFEFLRENREKGFLLNPQLTMHANDLFMQIIDKGQVFDGMTLKLLLSIIPHIESISPMVWHIIYIGVTHDVGEIVSCAINSFRCIVLNPSINFYEGFAQRVLNFLVCSKKKNMTFLDVLTYIPAGLQINLGDCGVYPHKFGQDILFQSDNVSMDARVTLNFCIRIVCGRQHARKPFEEVTFPSILYRFCRPYVNREFTSDIKSSAVEVLSNFVIGILKSSYIFRADLRKNDGFNDISVDRDPITIDRQIVYDSILAICVHENDNENGRYIDNLLTFLSSLHFRDISNYMFIFDAIIEAVLCNIDKNLSRIMDFFSFNSKKDDHFKWEFVQRILLLCSCEHVYARGQSILLFNLLFVSSKEMHLYHSCINENIANAVKHIMGCADISYEPSKNALFFIVRNVISADVSEVEMFMQYVYSEEDKKRMLAINCLEYLCDLRSLDVSEVIGNFCNALFERDYALSCSEGHLHGLAYILELRPPVRQVLTCNRQLVGDLLGLPDSIALIRVFNALISLSTILDIESINVFAGGITARLIKAIQAKQLSEIASKGLRNVLVIGMEPLQDQVVTQLSGILQKQASESAADINIGVLNNVIDVLSARKQGIVHLSPLLYEKLPSILKLIDRVNCSTLFELMEKIQIPPSIYESVFEFCINAYFKRHCLKNLLCFVERNLNVLNSGFLRLNEYAVYRFFMGICSVNNVCQYIRNSNLTISCTNIYKVLKIAGTNFNEDHIVQVVKVLEEHKKSGRSLSGIREIILELTQAIDVPIPLIKHILEKDPNCKIDPSLIFSVSGLSESALKVILPRSLRMTGCEAFLEQVIEFCDMFVIGRILRILGRGKHSSPKVIEVANNYMNTVIKLRCIYYLCAIDPQEKYFDIVLFMNTEDRQVALDILKIIINKFGITIGFRKTLTSILQHELYYKNLLYLAYPLIVEVPELIDQAISVELLDSICRLFSTNSLMHQRIARGLLSRIIDAQFDDQNVITSMCYSNYVSKCIQSDLEYTYLDVPLDGSFIVFSPDKLRYDQLRSVIDQEVRKEGSIAVLSSIFGPQLTNMFVAEYYTKNLLPLVDQLVLNDVAKSNYTPGFIRYDIVVYLNLDVDEFLDISEPYLSQMLNRSANILESLKKCPYPPIGLVMKLIRDGDVLDQDLSRIVSKLENPPVFFNQVDLFPKNNLRCSNDDQSNNIRNKGLNLFDSSRMTVRIGTSRSPSDDTSDFSCLGCLVYDTRECSLSDSVKLITSVSDIEYKNVAEKQDIPAVLRPSYRHFLMEDYRGCQIKLELIMEHNTNEDSIEQTIALWAECSIRLQQWDLVSEYAGVTGNKELLLEAAFRECSFVVDKDRQFLRSIVCDNQLSVVVCCIVSLFGESSPIDAINKAMKDISSFEYNIRTVTCARIIREINDIVAHKCHTDIWISNELDLMDVDLFIVWKMHYYDILTSLFPTDGKRYYHEKAQCILFLAKVYRSRGIFETSLYYNQKVFALPGIEPNDAYKKIIGDVKSYIGLGQTDHAIEELNIANLSFFIPEHKANIFGYKAMLCSADASMYYPQALQIHSDQVKNWYRWGVYLDGLLSQNFDVNTCIMAFACFLKVVSEADNFYYHKSLLKMFLYTKYEGHVDFVSIMERFYKNIRLDKLLFYIPQICVGHKFNICKFLLCHLLKAFPIPVYLFLFGKKICWDEICDRGLITDSTSLEMLRQLNGLCKCLQNNSMENLYESLYEYMMHIVKHNGGDSILYDRIKHNLDLVSLDISIKNKILSELQEDDSGKLLRSCYWWVCKIELLVSGNIVLCLEANIPLFHFYSRLQPQYANPTYIANIDHNVCVFCRGGRVYKLFRVLGTDGLLYNYTYSCFSRRSSDEEDNFGKFIQLLNMRQKFPLSVVNYLDLGDLGRIENFETNTVNFGEITNCIANLVDLRLKHTDFDNLVAGNYTSNMKKFTDAISFELRRRLSESYVVMCYISYVFMMKLPNPISFDFNIDTGQMVCHELAPGLHSSDGTDLSLRILRLGPVIAEFLGRQFIECDIYAVIKRVQKQLKEDWCVDAINFLFPSKCRNLDENGDDRDSISCCNDFKDRMFISEDGIHKLITDSLSIETLRQLPIDQFMWV